MSIGNINKSIRRKPSEHATMLIGYLPVTKLECFSKAKRQFEGYQLFHKCMASLLHPLIEAGQNGVKMTCADGRVRRVFPILAAYIADYPEQCLISCCMENRCPKCIVSPDELGDHFHSALRDHNDTIRILAEESKGMSPREFKEQGLRPIWPFWADLPYCDIFSCMTPDLLHQLHKGFFKDHIVSWSIKAMDGHAGDVDARYQVMPPHPTLRHFKKGISLVTQWTGTEHKNMEKVFLGAIAGISAPSTIRAVRAVLDFIYYAHFESHTFRSLALLDKAWVAFHKNKDVFVEKCIRSHFNIPKIHASRHYLDAIRTRGSADGFNSEGTERLHIDYAKVGYRSTNKKKYIKQMTKWLTRREKIDRFSAYLQWAAPILEANATGLGPDIDEDSLVGAPQPCSSSGSPRRGYSIAKTPSYTNVTLSDVQNSFGAIDILPCINTYLQKLGRPVPREVVQHKLQFSLFKRMYVWIPAAPQVSQEPTRDTIIATCSERSSSSRMKAVPAQFSTALIRESEPDSRFSGPLDGAA
jgi:hypothetical protein